MRPTIILYAMLGLVGIGAAIAVPVWLNRSGSEAVPFWTAAVNPGPLSAAHDFIGAQCETCHTPTRGVEATACLTCHVTAAPALLPQPATTFHADIGQCASCHVEHQGRDRRPINMDHSALVVAGHTGAAQDRQPGSETNAPDLRHTMALVRTFLDRSRADLAGGPLGRRSLPVA
ncbi:MAG: class cytochrome family protein, partial [Roseomonas sp.]|nr:class cytochrome family protein [Roseomonas sp.]